MQAGLGMGLSGGELAQQAQGPCINPQDKSMTLVAGRGGHTCNPAIPKAEAGGPQLQSQPQQEN